MSAESMIRDALLPLGWEVENAVYTGKAGRYIVFSTDHLGDDFGDDAPEHEKVLVAVHLNAPLGENIRPVARGAQRALYEAGCTWPRIIEASDDGGRHLVLECEMEVGVDGET